ncbi:MAG: iron-containing alcohol dehydrogenase [Treponema sp.]|nr:iron-containing alcohol dehydrogenase [Treponema sp.]
MDISFKIDPEVLIGSDTVSMAGTIASRHGSRIMIAADHNLDSNTVNRLKDVLIDSGLEAIVFDGIEESSSVEMADNIVELACAAHCNAIIGFGGEKTQIIARMAAIMAPMRITAFELLDGRIYHTKFFPLIAIPTEGMSAFSMTGFFIASDPRSRMVKSIQSPKNLYSAVIIDSNLFSFLSQNNAAAFVTESFFYAVEAYCSARGNFLSDALIERALTFYVKILRSGSGALAANAEVFAQASFLSAVGSSASCPGVGAALSAAINARTPIAKPLCSAALFPCLAERLVSARPEKMARLAAMLGAGKAATVADTAAASVEAIKRTISALSVPISLKEYNISLDHLTAASEAARSLDLTSNSPWTVSEEEVFKILKEIL